MLDPPSTHNSPLSANLFPKSPAPSPSSSVSTATSSSSSISSLSSSPILPSSSSFDSTRSSTEKEGLAEHQVMLIYRPAIPIASSWLATTNPGFSSIWLTTSHHHSYHPPVTTKKDGVHGSSFSDW